MRLLLRALTVFVTSAIVATIVCKATVKLLPATGQVRVAHELTGSMRPAIPVGGLILYRPIQATRLKPRDVISFHRTGYVETVTHRVVSVSRSGATIDVVTRGDANNADDSQTATFARHETVWRVAHVLPAWVGAVVFALVSHGTPLVLSLLPLALLLPWIRRQLVGRPASVAAPEPEPVS
jgi:signal peptidase